MPPESDRFFAQPQVPKDHEMLGASPLVSSHANGPAAEPLAVESSGYHTDDTDDAVIFLLLALPPSPPWIDPLHPTASSSAAGPSILPLFFTLVLLAACDTHEFTLLARICRGWNLPVTSGSHLVPSWFRPAGTRNTVVFSRYRSSLQEQLASPRSALPLCRSRLHPPVTAGSHPVPSCSLHPPVSAGSHPAGPGPDPGIRRRPPI